MNRLKILTWHIHGSYLYYLSHVPHDFYVPVKSDRSMGYCGRTESYPWPANVIEIPAEEVSRQKFDCVLYQHSQNWQADQYEILTEEQRKLPRIFLEHNPPLQVPTETLHPVDNSNVLIVHVTAFNELMWNNRNSPTKVIEHGVFIPNGVRYQGDLNRGITVINNILSRGRRMGWDLLDKVRQEIPVDLVGMGWKEARGLCEVQHADLPRFCSRYRFFYSPVRYSSLALSVCEAMMVGLPIVGLATTEMVTVIENGVSGFLDTDSSKVIEMMKELQKNPDLARELGEGARKTALERFHMDRFIREWDETFREVTGGPRPSRGAQVSLQSIKEQPQRRIAMISEHASPLSSPGSVDCGGQNVYVAHLSQKLAQAGYQVDVFTRWDHRDHPEVYEWKNGVRVIHVPAGPPRFVKKENLLPYMDEFTDYVEKFIHFQKEPYELIHANFWMSGLVAADLKQRLSIPFAITFHALGRVRRLYQGKADEFCDERFTIEDRIVAEADRLIAECPQDFEDLKNLYGADPQKITIIPCGFDPDEIYPIDQKVARDVLGLQADELIALQLGRMVPRKGVDLAIRGFAKALEKQNLKARLVIVGGESDEPDPEQTPEISRLRKIAREEGVLDRVLFFGRCDRDQLKFLFSAADVFLTTPWYEPFGITPLEAMACGTPVIGTNVGGIKYSVIDRETGYLIPPQSAAVLGDRLIKLFTQKELHQRMSDQSLRRAYQYFTWEQVSFQMKKLFEEMLEHPLAPRRAGSEKSERPQEPISIHAYLKNKKPRKFGGKYEYDSFER